MQADFELLETIRVESDGTIRLLARHLERISASARYFKYACDAVELREVILTAAAEQSEVVIFRLLLARDGGYRLGVRSMPSAQLTRLVRAPGEMDSENRMLYHKTTARAIYENARAGCDEETDVLFSNERDEATETTIANIAVLRGDQWVTPKLSCGLLPGTMRAELLEQGQIVEGIVFIDELAPGETIRCFNAVRGIFEVRFEDILAT